MNRQSTRSLLSALLVLFCAGSLARAQSLGEVAAKEKERREQERQKNGGSAKVITEGDLHGAGRGTFSNAGSTAVESEPAKEGAKDAAKEGAAAPAKEKTEDELRAEKQAGWRKGLQDAQAQVEQLSNRVSSLQVSLNDTGGLYTSGRAEAVSQLEKAKGDLAAAQQKVSDLEEEGRRNGFR